MQTITCTVKKCYQLQEERYQLRESNEILKVGAYDWFSNSDNKVLFDTKILSPVHDLPKKTTSESASWKLSSF